MSTCQVLTVHYPSALTQTVTKLFNSLNQQYATIFMIPHDQSVLLNIIMNKNKILLKKRKTYLIILVGQQLSKLPDNTQYSTVHFYLGKQQLKETLIPKNIKNRYNLDGTLQIDDLSKKMIQLLQLDFIWIGLLSRLGASIQQFAAQLTQTQNFLEMEIVQEIYFTQILDKLLGKDLSLEQALHATHLSLLKLVEIYVMEKFNSRFLIRHITYTKYFKLLLSRNYFHLIYVQCSILDRFKNFKTIIQEKYRHINNILTLQTFVQIDDFWYSNFIQKCTPFASYTINRMIKKQPYSQVIKKYYSKIIRHFRPNLDEYFIQICQALKDRSGCIKQAVGAIIVKDKRIIATGYNGTPINSINCYNGGCNVCNNSENINTQVLSCNCIHAQYSCILQAGIKITPGCTLYTTGLPCLWCTKLIIQAKIETVIYVENSYSKLKHENQNVILQTFKDAKTILKQVKHEQRILD